MSPIHWKSAESSFLNEPEIWMKRDNHDLHFFHPNPFLMNYNLGTKEDNSVKGFPKNNSATFGGNKNRT